MDVVKTSKAYVTVPKVYLSSVTNPKKENFFLAPKACVG
ncbi:hypothetical protein LEP1GSC196_0148 [Leptospira meyeri serovar Semaranga str. Veldrot Semarang 173]|nr:hypothetical protein LEP1GSC196_0148 [Leptospira meyeri serovar Semaranga str. Veldrot Semarang 173]